MINGVKRIVTHDIEQCKPSLVRLYLTMIGFSAAHELIIGNPSHYRKFTIDNRTKNTSKEPGWAKKVGSRFWYYSPCYRIDAAAIGRVLMLALEIRLFTSVGCLQIHQQNMCVLTIGSS